MKKHITVAGPFQGKITGAHFLNMGVGSSIARIFPQKEVRLMAKIQLLLP